MLIHGFLDYICDIKTIVIKCTPHVALIYSSLCSIAAQKYHIFKQIQKNWLTHSSNSTRLVAEVWLPLPFFTLLCPQSAHAQGPPHYSPRPLCTSCTISQLPVISRFHSLSPSPLTASTRGGISFPYTFRCNHSGNCVESERMEKKRSWYLNMLISWRTHPKCRWWPDQNESWRSS